MFSKEKPLPMAVLSPRKNVTTTNNAVSEGVHLGDGIYWNHRKLPNPHLAIIGASGSGKTQTMKAIAHELHQQNNCNIIILDFHGDQELPGETCYPLHMASPCGINPLEINLDPEGGGPELASDRSGDNFEAHTTDGSEPRGANTRNSRGFIFTAWHYSK